MQAVLYIVENSMQTVSKVLEQKTVPFIASASPRTRSPAVAGMADSWPHINLIDFHFRDLEMTP